MPGTAMSNSDALLLGHILNSVNFPWTRATVAGQQLDYVSIELLNDLDEQFHEG